jgi:NMD protein affecting ribosome stability and mRNA decay
MKMSDLLCPQCGDPTEQLHEGYCEDCCTENQAALDQHNAEFDRWERLSRSERETEIRGAHQ